MECLTSRRQTHPSGEIMFLNKICPVPLVLIECAGGGSSKAVKHQCSQVAHVPVSIHSDSGIDGAAKSSSRGKSWSKKPFNSNLCILGSFSERSWSYVDTSNMETKEKWSGLQAMRQLKIKSEEHNRYIKHSFAIWKIAN